MAENERYARHYALHGFGREAQQKLARSSVLVVGAGGLGCPVLQYLTAAGVGRIGVMDQDTVALSNLQRQVLYLTEDIGKSKAEVAAVRLSKQNPDIKISSFDAALTTDNAAELVSQFEVIVDCTDNFPTRYLLNDVCVLLGKPLVFGAIFRYEGQVAVFNAGNSGKRTVNYRDFFPTPPAPSEVPDCNEAGVLGVLPGAIGILQAAEVIKLITGVGELLSGKLLSIDLLDYRTYVVDISPDDTWETAMPKSLEEFRKTDYDFVCGIGNTGIETIGTEAFLQQSAELDTIVIDVRNPGEWPELTFRNRNIPLGVLRENMAEISETTIIVICQSGKRSLAGAQLLRDFFGKSRSVLNLRGGINALTTELNE